LEIARVVLEPPPQPDVGSRSAAEHLERDHAIEAHVAGTIELAIPPAPSGSRI
jgi:hypothetical protein